MLLSKVLSIVVYEATLSRGRDLAAGPYDDQKDSYLRFQDISMRFDGGEKLGTLEALLTIRGEKGHKYVQFRVWPLD